MDASTWQLLHRGDIVRHRLTGEPWIISDTLSDGRLLLVRTSLASDPQEWELPLFDDTPKALGSL